MSLGMNAPADGRRFGTMNDVHSHSAVYWGEHGDHYVVAACTRDSDALDRSNFQVLQARLGDRAIVEESSHWACGWVKYMLIAPDDRAAIRIAVQAHKDVEQYPILDDSHMSQLEYDEFWEYAESELKGFENWHVAVRAALDESSGGYSEDEMGGLIETAREQLEAEEELYAVQARSHIDPAQAKLFAGMSDRVPSYF